MSFIEFVPIVVTVTLFPTMLALMALGERIARRSEPSQSGPIEAAVLALLGLLLGFQFAGASSRLDSRRHIVVKEANAIGTAYLRLDLLPSDDQPQLRDLFRKYITLRIQMVSTQRLDDGVALDAASRAMQPEIWAKAIVACRKDPSPATRTLVLAALNDMFDVTTERATASRTHTPLATVALLIGVALTSAFLVGRSTSGLPRSWTMRALFAVVVIGTMYVTMDMEFPRIGLIQVGAADEAMTATLRGME
ncbi:MAG: DUF4239 domain-containing protein [Planctomycetaceae bacterium]|nr:DUF4239 domain-containing protein [Planctomycetaceae bacterium]